MKKNTSPARHQYQTQMDARLFAALNDGTASQALLNLYISWHYSEVGYVGRRRHGIEEW